MISQRMIYIDPFILSFIDCISWNRVMNTVHVHPPSTSDKPLFAVVSQFLIQILSNRNNLALMSYRPSITPYLERTVRSLLTDSTEIIASKEMSVTRTRAVALPRAIPRRLLNNIGTSTTSRLKPRCIHDTNCRECRGIRSANKGYRPTYQRGRWRHI